MQRRAEGAFLEWLRLHPEAREAGCGHLFFANPNPCNEDATHFGRVGTVAWVPRCAKHTRAFGTVCELPSENCSQEKK